MKHPVSFHRVVASLAALAAAASLSVRAAEPSSPELERLSLASARALLLERNRDILFARHTAAGAEAQITAAGAPPNPTLNASMGKIGPADAGAPPLRRRIESSIGVSQLFERGEKRELRTQAAEQLARAARSDVAETTRQQRIALDQAYFDLVLAQERERIATETAGLFDRTLEAADRRVRAGDLSRTDYVRLSVDALRAKNEAEAAKLEHARAQIALAQLIGVEREPGRLVAADTWPAIVERVSAAEGLQAIEQRADVQAARARLAAADRARELSQALRTRDVTAGVQYDRAPSDISRNTIGFSVSIPLFTRYTYEGEIQRGEADYLAAQTSLDRVRAGAAAEITTAAAALASAAERVRRFRDVLLGAAEQASNGAEFAYSRGAIGVMDLLDARRQLFATRLESVQASADYAKAWSAWNAVSGAEGDSGK